MKRGIGWRAVLCILALVVPSVVCGQYPGGADGAITGVGSVEIKRPAQLLRMKVQLISKGKDLKDALAKLEDRKTAAAKHVEELTAVKGSVRFGEPEIQEADPNTRRQMEMMLGQRNKGKKKTTKLAVPVSVVCALEADWELSGAGAELLLAVHTLEGKIKAADIGGSADAEKLSPEEQELLDEMQENFGRYSSSDEMKPGEPVFAYVSRITEAERDAAMQDAFRKAKEQAALLAKAGGLQLGAVKSLSSYAAGHFSRGYSNDYARMQRLQAAFGGDDIDDSAPASTEALSASPTAVKHVLSVTVAFDAKE